MNLSSPVSAPTGFISEPPLSPGAAPIPMSTPPQPTASPASGGTPSLEAQVVRLGLMTPDDVATTMREEAETGRSFAELAVEAGRIKAEDLAKLTGEEPQRPIAAVPDSEPEAAPAPPAVAVLPTSAPEHSARAEVFVALTSGERISLGSFEDQKAAENRARELMAALDGDGEWPRLDGRFIRPDAVVSIDVALDA
jgi:hypothetical protein